MGGWVEEYGTGRLSSAESDPVPKDLPYLEGTALRYNHAHKGAFVSILFFLRHRYMHC
jgi:hypothetical protein